LKLRADSEGLPYQTLLSSIVHKFVTDQLVDKKKYSQKHRITQSTEQSTLKAHHQIDRHAGLGNSEMGRFGRRNKKGMRRLGSTGDPSSLCKLRRTGREGWPPASPSCRLYPPACRPYGLEAEPEGPAHGGKVN